MAAYARLHLRGLGAQHLIAGGVLPDSVPEGQLGFVLRRGSEVILSTDPASAPSAALSAPPQDHDPPGAGTGVIHTPAVLVSSRELADRAGRRV